MNEKASFTSKTSIDSAWAAFLRDTASDRSTWEAFQYAWLARGDLDPTFQQLEAQCQAIWRTNVTLVCHLPKGHEGDHRCGRHTFNGECDIRAMRPDETTELHPTSEADKLLDAAEITIRLCKGSCSKDIQRRIKGYLNAKFPGHIVSLSVEPTPDRLAQSTWTCEHCARVNDTDTTFNRCPFCDEFRKGYAEKATALPPGSCTRCGDTGFLRIEGRTENCPTCNR